MKFLLLTLSSLVPATLWADFPKAWQFGFQDPATDLMGKVISLHHGISIVMAGVTLFVLILVYVLMLLDLLRLFFFYDILLENMQLCSHIKVHF